jgi:hypothetical protein
MLPGSLWAGCFAAGHGLLLLEIPPWAWASVPGQNNSNYRVKVGPPLALVLAGGASTGSRYCQSMPGKRRRRCR